VIRKTCWFFLSPITYHPSPFLEIIFFVIVVSQIVFFDDVQLDGVESDDLELSPALFARDDIVLFRVRINVDIRFAFRACSGRHFISPLYVDDDVEADPGGETSTCLLSFEPPTI
jgi:hypothetical protein